MCEWFWCGHNLLSNTYNGDCSHHSLIKIRLVPYTGGVGSFLIDFVLADVFLSFLGYAASTGVCFTLHGSGILLVGKVRGTHAFVF